MKTLKEIKQELRKSMEEKYKLMEYYLSNRYDAVKHLQEMNGEDEEVTQEDLITFEIHDFIRYNYPNRVLVSKCDLLAEIYEVKGILKLDKYSKMRGEDLRTEQYVVTERKFEDCINVIKEFIGITYTDYIYGFKCLEYDNWDDKYRITFSYGKLENKNKNK